MMSGPKYHPGQVVRFTPGTHERAYGGLYEVVARLPEERGERQYRVKSTSDSHERMVRESQISSANQESGTRPSAGGKKDPPPAKSPPPRRKGDTRTRPRGA